MIHPQASLPCPSVLDEAACSAEGGWYAWLGSAEMVLRGEPISGPFLVVADPKQRRFLASALMLGNTALDDDWKRWVCRASCDSSLRRSDFDSRGRFAPDRSRASAPCLPDLDARCWQRFFHHPYGSTRSRYRRQAAAAFPYLVAMTVLVAHSEDRWPRVRAAWEVIDRIDRGEPLIPALRAFLHVGKAELRASRHCTLIPPLYGAWSRIRGMLRAVVKLPLEKRPIRSVDWDAAFIQLPLLALLLRHARPALAHAFPPSERTSEDLRILGLTHPRARVGVLRSVARNVAKLRCEHGAASRIVLLPQNTPDHSVHAERLGEEERHRMHGEPRLIELGDGWTAKTLVSIAELEYEGRQMRHCIVDYAELLRERDGFFFALRQANGNEAVTLRVAPCDSEELRGETNRDLVEALPDHPAMAIEIGGVGNAPVSISALRAMMTLIERLWPGHRFCFI